MKIYKTFITITVAIAIAITITTVFAIDIVTNLIEQLAKLLGNRCKGELHVSLTIRPAKVGAHHHRPKIDIYSDDFDDAQFWRVLGGLQESKAILGAILQAV